VTVHFGADDFFGDKKFRLAAPDSVNYKFLVAPLRAMERILPSPSIGLSRSFKDRRLCQPLVSSFTRNQQFR
jgi:hypothetical protein